MRLIAFIMAIFIFSGATSACGVSDMCCGDGDAIEMSNCCQSESQDNEVPMQGDSNKCCDSCTTNIPLLLTVLSTLNNAQKITAYLQFPPVQQRSYDFHVDVWQPPRFS